MVYNTLEYWTMDKILRNYNSLTELYAPNIAVL
jgi:hypothetical protein